MIQKQAHGRSAIILNAGKIKNYLMIDEKELTRLQIVFAGKQYYDIKYYKPKIIYFELAKQYQMYIDAGVVTNRAELARHLGVSRAWVTKVFSKAQT